MTVSNGQLANQTTFNDAFMSRTQNTSTIGKVNLKNTSDVNSGAEIFNAQRAINETFDTVGIGGEGDSSRKDYASNNVVANGTSHKVAIGALDGAFDLSTGHNHDGTNSPKVSAADLIDINYYRADWQSVNLSAVSGTTYDVSAGFVSKTPGGSTISVGVVTDPPLNRCELRDLLTETYLEDGSGNRVYARLTESAGVWTASFFVLISGVETAYSLPSTDIILAFKEVFTLDALPTFGADSGVLGSFDLSGDIIDASPTERGLVSISAQSFGGDKTFEDKAIFNEFAAVKSDVATASSIAALATITSLVKLTGSTASNILGLDNGFNGKRVIVANGSTADLTFKHQDAGALAADRIITPDGSDLVVEPNQAVEFVYDSTDARWRVASTAGSGGGGNAYQELLGTGDGLTTSFGPLSYTPTNDDGIAVFLNGVLADAADWSRSGANIVFSVAPPAAASVYVYYLTSGTPMLSLTQTFKVEHRTLTVGEISAKQITLASTPVSAADIMVDVKGGGAQFLADDYTVTGAVLSWNALGLDGILTAGDKLRIAYTT